MFPTAARLSKASRRPLTPKRGNKDFYKGTRQAALPGGHRTGAPGRFIVRGSGKYRLLDEKVRVFVAPHISEINQCEDLYSLMPLTPGAPSPRWRETRITNRLASAASKGKKEVPTTLPESRAKGGVLQWFKGITSSKEKTV
ncbi:hypothetical protein EV401DRAFT_436926 [Pisolithus croceorrhizus]|nr:hypothetical protein EV401DRAFT_436926 [Pisolithus croceorrhizus]